MTKLKLFKTVQIDNAAIRKICLKMLYITKLTINLRILDIVAPHNIIRGYWLSQYRW